MNTTQNNLNPCETPRRSSPPLTHFYIYENLDLISDRVFDQQEITIGSSRNADVFLDHQSVAEIHAMVHHKEDQVFLTNNFPQNGLRLNGRSVGLAELQHEDVIDIGPFSLKVKMSAPEPETAIEDPASYAVRLVNRYGSAQAMQTAAIQLARLLKAAPDKVMQLLAREHFILKKGLNGIDAARLQNTLLKAGVICDVQMEEVDPSPVEMPELSLSGPAEAPPTPTATMIVEEALPQQSLAHDPVVQPAAESVVRRYAQPDTQIVEAPSVVSAPPSLEVEALPSEPQETEEIYVSFTELFQDEEDEEEEEIWEAPFVLKTKLDQSAAPAARAQKLPEQLQVIKTIGDAVVDVRFLQGRQKYFINTDKGRFCLAGAKGDGYVSLLPDFSGYVQSPSGEAKADLESYKTSDFLYRQRKSIYRIPLPGNDAVVVDAGGCRYRIAQVQAAPSPHVTVAQPKSTFTWRHWASSAGTHFVLILCLSVYMFFQAGPAKAPEPHFVKIDPSLLQKLQAPKELPKPKPPPPPPKPEPQKVAKKVKPIKKKPVKKKPPAKVAKGRKTVKKGVRTAQVSKDPKAGGGFGKGNIKNRNINQTGILSVLGSSSLGGPSQAIASVTNLDAVAVPGATKKNFSVGGLKGALGNGKIAVATGQIIQTKGGAQVLRSAGARGKGTVAALERGTTGKKKVRSLVTAKMNRTVKIEGGMSREMVKRVIDQHLEEITFCYETALMSNPSILGRIVFEWKILMNGRVGEIRIVASSVNSHEIHDCIKTAIKSWQFPKPVGAEVVVSYPFVFDLVTF